MDALRAGLSPFFCRAGLLWYCFLAPCPVFGFNLQAPPHARAWQRSHWLTLPSHSQSWNRRVGSYICPELIRAACQRSAALPEKSSRQRIPTSSLRFGCRPQAGTTSSWVSGTEVGQETSGISTCRTGFNEAMPPHRLILGTKATQATVVSPSATLRK